MGRDITLNNRDTPFVSIFNCFYALLDGHVASARGRLRRVKIRANI